MQLFGGRRRRRRHLVPLAYTVYVYLYNSFIICFDGSESMRRVRVKHTSALLFFRLENVNVRRGMRLRVLPV